MASTHNSKSLVGLDFGATRRMDGIFHRLHIVLYFMKPGERVKCLAVVKLDVTYTAQ